MSFEHINERTRETHKAAWSNLRGQGNLLDLARARFLHRVLREHLNDDTESLESYLTIELEEYRGKRTSALLRMVAAFATDTTEAHWRILGGNGMALLTRVDGRSRARVLAAVREVMKNTKRDSISMSSFRSILRATLGAAYAKVRLETRRAQPLMTYRDQAIIFQRQILTLLAVPGVRAKITPDVRVLLKLDKREPA